MRLPRVLFIRSAVFALFFATTLGFLGCNGGDDDTSNGGKATNNGNSKPDELEEISMGTAPVGGAFQPVGQSLSETLNEHKGDNNWQVTAKGTKGSQENIRRLQNAEYQLGLSNSAITHFAVNGGGSWDQEYDMCAVVTIAPNVAMFITKQDSGIKKVADLKGKRVVCGPSGAGFDMFIEPILKAHGVTYDDFGKKLNNNQNGAVDMLADGQADAAFLGGAVPTSSIQRACSEQDVHFIPYDEKAVESLLAEYPFFQRVTIPADKYSDLTEDFPCLNVGSMHLITSADESEDRIYQITKTLYENRTSINHPAAKFINEKNAARFTGTPFHPGAQKYYEEAGIWPKAQANGDSSADGKSDG